MMTRRYDARGHLLTAEQLECWHGFPMDGNYITDTCSKCGYVDHGGLIRHEHQPPQPAPCGEEHP
jgi:hypothetical protein